MRAIYFTEFNGPLSIQELPIPRASANSVVIKVAATGLCRSDWHGYVGHDADIKLPHVPGHEFAGTISEIGSNVKKFKVGDRVAIPFVNGCGECEYCKSGRAQVCPQQTQPGFTHHGSFAEYVLVENGDFNLIALPDEIDFNTAAALGCRFATSFRGLVDRAQVRSGQFVAIYGCGGIGLSALLIARAFGARVICIDINQNSLHQAKNLGAEFIINSREEDPVSTIIGITNGGADISIDALGSQSTSNQSILSLRRNGKHLQLGLLLTSDGTTPIPMARAIAYELDILGSHGMAAVDYPKMLALISSGKLEPQLLITNEVNLEIGAQELARMGENLGTGVTIIRP